MVALAVTALASCVLALAFQAYRDRRALTRELGALRAQLHDLDDAIRRAGQDVAGDPLPPDGFPGDAFQVEPDPDAGSHQPARGRTLH